MITIICRTKVHEKSLTWRIFRHKDTRRRLYHAILDVLEEQNLFMNCSYIVDIIEIILILYSKNYLVA